MSHIYEFNKDGNLYLMDPDRDVVMAKHALDAHIGIFFDKNVGCIFKHGTSSFVKSYADTHRQSLANIPEFKDMVDDLIFIEIAVSSLNQNPEVIDLINKCLSTSGYAKKIISQLEADPMNILFA